MRNNMDVRNQGFSSINQIRDSITKTNPGQTTKSKGVDSASQSFQEIFRQLDGVKFSKHAAQRLESRNISMTDSQRARLEDATFQAKEKGMNESLVMVDNLAFIVNVKNNTVITAVNSVEKGVFTNIDGAIIN